MISGSATADTLVKLRRLLGINELSERQMTLLWLFLQTHGQGFVGGPNAVDAMLLHLQTHHFDLAQSRTFLTHNLLAEEQLDWIEDGVRQNKWLLMQLERASGQTCLPIARDVLGGRRLTIALMDLWVPELQQRINHIGSIKNQWIVQVKLDRKFAWFEKADEAGRCKLMFDFLEQKAKINVYGIQPFATLEEMLIFFDDLGKSFSNEQIELWIEKVKRSWSQQQHRLRQTDKKQVNLVLSKKSIAQLEKLSRKYGISRAQIAEILINDEAERQIYMSERLKKSEAFAIDR